MHLFLFLDALFTCTDLSIRISFFFFENLIFCIFWGEELINWDTLNLDLCLLGGFLSIAFDSCMN